MRPVESRRAPSSVVATITGRDDVARVQALLDEMAGAHRLRPDVVADMRVALDEVLTNILQNGFADGLPHSIKVKLSLVSETLTAEVEDDCAPFDPLAVPPPHLGASLKERRVGGLGVHFLRNLMSEVSYTRVGARNRLVLKRSLTDDGQRSTDGPA